jgi:hypothetical protein
MLPEERHADERIDFGRFDLDGSLAAVRDNRCSIDAEGVKLAVGNVLGTRLRRCAANGWMRKRFGGLAPAATCLNRCAVR